MVTLFYSYSLEAGEDPLYGVVPEPPASESPGEAR